MTKRQIVKSEPTGAVDGRDRAKDFLNEGEVDRLLRGARQGRHGPRDHLLMLMMYRHGLRVSEAIGLRRDGPRPHHRPLVGAPAQERPLGRAADRRRRAPRHQAYLAARSDRLPWLFLSERDQPLTRQAAHYLVATAARRAGLGDVHPHTLRHACGYYLANRGHDLRLIQDYLGHREPRHTAHYTRVAAHRFEGLWDGR